jgi:homoserine O-acetyltransferase/O-succinyltransferase
MPIRTAVALAAIFFAASAYAQLLTEKKFFTLPQYTTAGGKTIKNVRVGYETYGKLNAAGDNAVFVPHFFSGTSHAAGRYKADEKAAGYWDAIIGSGKAIDTDKYFVVSADTLVNLNVKSPMVGTVGPASLNPDTGKPYGSSFPVVSMKDSVRVHKALLDSLGVKKLQAVAGASGGRHPGDGVGGGISAARRASGARHRAGTGRAPVYGRHPGCVGHADKARSELERRRLLRRR